MPDLPVILQLGFAGAATATGLHILMFAKRIDDDIHRDELKYGLPPSTRRPHKWGIRIGGFWLFAAGGGVLLEATLRSFGVQSAG